MPCFKADTTDVAIIGGGPAGAAAALTLRSHAPGLRTTLLEAGRWSVAKPGEILPAAARGLLERLGVIARVEAAGFGAARAIASTWTSEMLAEHHSIYSAQGAGWHLDRRHFDRLLAEAAAAAGSAIASGVAVRSAVPEGEGWRLVLADGRTLAARSVIWATGRNWRLARPFGARVRVHDSLAAFARFLDDAPGDGRTLIEPRPEGWWYSADLPGRRRIVACLTDPDIARAMGLRDRQGWRRALEAAPFMSELVPAGARDGEAVTCSAGTVTVEPAAGRRWVAAGDTLFAADPLSSRGIIHALRSGMLAAYATADMLDGREAEALRRYGLIRDWGFQGYERSLSAHYDEAAGRWNTPFWQRRRAGSAAAAGAGAAS